MLKKYWDDYKVGEKMETQAITITEAHLVNWAGFTGDFYPAHMDIEYAKKGPFGARIAHGPLTLAIATGLVIMSRFYEDSIICWLGLENLRVPLPVKIGDTIRVEVEVKEKRETQKPERGIIILIYKVKNQRDEDVMTLDFLVMVHRRTG